MQVKTKIKITDVGKSWQKEGQLKTLIKIPKPTKTWLKIAKQSEMIKCSLTLQLQNNSAVEMKQNLWDLNISIE